MPRRLARALVQGQVQVQVLRIFKQEHVLGRDRVRHSTRLTAGLRLVNPTLTLSAIPRYSSTPEFFPVSLDPNFESATFLARVTIAQILDVIG